MPQFQEQAFFDYHLYTLRRTTSLNNESTKQIELFPTKANVPINKVYVYYGLPNQYRGGTHPRSPAATSASR